MCFSLLSTSHCNPLCLTALLLLGPCWWQLSLILENSGPWGSRAKQGWGPTPALLKASLSSRKRISRPRDEPKLGQDWRQQQQHVMPIVSRHAEQVKAQTDCSGLILPRWWRMGSLTSTFRAVWVRMDQHLRVQHRATMPEFHSAFTFQRQPGVQAAASEVTVSHPTTAFSSTLLDWVLYRKIIDFPHTANYQLLRLCWSSYSVRQLKYPAEWHHLARFYNSIPLTTPKPSTLNATPKQHHHYNQDKILPKEMLLS